MSLEPGKHVTVRLPGGDSLPAHIEDADATSVTVALLLKAHLALSVFKDRVARVEYADKRGLHKFSCTVLDALPGDRLRLLHEAEDVVQRRDYFRVEAFAQLTITTREDSPRTLETNSHDLSAGGMLIADPIEIPAETVLDIQLTLDGGATVKAVGRVIRNTGDKKTAVQIVEISQSDRQQLMRYITERQRAALRVAGGV
jgi:c-di-GMP-binding flagellar brake protein YcgR